MLDVGKGGMCTFVWVILWRRMKIEVRWEKSAVHEIVRTLVFVPKMYLVFNKGEHTQETEKIHSCGFAPQRLVPLIALYSST